MQSDANEIFQAALGLSESERLALATRLMATVPEQSITLSLDDEDLEAELDRRFADQSGNIPWSELRKQR
jgi:putative addiction module component (TIGR02574 family)